ncbi:MAG: acyl-CoA desaturase [Patescibacteria group bacterium]
MLDNTHLDNSRGAVVDVQPNSWVHDVVTLLGVTLPIVAVLIGAISLTDGLPPLYVIVMMVVFRYLTAWGITIGFHRLFTHRSFEARRPVVIMLAVLGSLALEGAIIAWVADHRRHHDFTDEPEDPHSPHVSTSGEFKDLAWGTFRGLWHAHWGWLFTVGSSNEGRYANDLVKDPTIRLISKLFPLFALLTIAIPVVLGYAIDGTQGMWDCLIWAVGVRIFWVHHATWFVNSIGHMYGKRPFVPRTKEDKSTNNAFVALVAEGEGWHHNHHVFPLSAKHGILPGQIDVSYRIIKALEKVGLTRNVDMHVPSEEKISAKLAEAKS